jgi:rubrerythrin
MPVSKKFIKIKKNDDGSYYECIEDTPEAFEGKKVNCCPFCDTRTASGSWSPETCPSCGAVYFFGIWSMDR